MDKDKPQDPANPSAATTSSPRSTLSLIVAALIAVFYIGASWFLLQHFALDNPLPETSWQRALIIYNGIASVGFAAIGVLLGTTVQQVNLAAATKEAANAKQDADKKGDAIKAAVNKLTNPAGKPADMGGGPATEETRLAEARSILMEVLR